MDSVPETPVDAVLTDTTQPEASEPVATGESQIETTNSTGDSDVAPIPVEESVGETNTQPAEEVQTPAVTTEEPAIADSGVDEQTPVEEEVQNSAGSVQEDATSSQEEPQVSTLPAEEETVSTQPEEVPVTSAQEEQTPVEEEVPTSGEPVQEEASSQEPQVPVETATEPENAPQEVPTQAEEQTALTPEEEAQAAQAAILEENRTYYVIDGAPLLVRESDKPHVLRGEVTLGAAGKDVTLVGRLVVPDSSAVVSASGDSLFGTTGAGQIPVDQGGKLGALLPTEAGQVLTLVADEATGAVLPAWRSVPEPQLPATKTTKKLFLPKDADQAIEKMVQTNVSGWAAPGSKLSYRDDFGLDLASGILTLSVDATANVDFDVRFQATLQAGSTTGSVTTFVLVDSGSGFESVAEQTVRPGPSAVYPFVVSISALPTLAPGSKLAIALWHDSSAPVTVVGGTSTTLSILASM